MSVLLDMPARSSESLMFLPLETEDTHPSVGVLPSMVILRFQKINNDWFPRNLHTNMRRIADLQLEF